MVNFSNVNTITKVLFEFKNRQCAIIIHTFVEMYNKTIFCFWLVFEELLVLDM